MPDFLQAEVELASGGYISMKQVFGALVLAASFAAAHDAQAGSGEPIDLDHLAPSEQLFTESEGSTILYWSAQNKLWLDIFRSASPIDGVADDAQSSLGKIKSGDRFWQWRNDAYVPLVAQEAVMSDGLPEDVYVAAVKSLNEFDEVPENNPVNMKVAMTVAGKPSFGALLGAPMFCSMGGTICPFVIFQDDKPTRAVYVDMSQSWGISPKVNGNGFSYVETQKDHSVTLTDSETGVETEIKGIMPKQADHQPSRPKDLP